MFFFQIHLLYINFNLNLILLTLNYFRILALYKSKRIIIIIIIIIIVIYNNNICIIILRESAVGI